MSVVNTDLCAFIWGAGTPPPPLPPGSGGVGGAPPYNVAGGSGGTVIQGQFTTGIIMAGELVNDSSSKLVGAVINEVDISLKRVGSPIGQVNCWVFNSAGKDLGVAFGPDASALTTGFVNYKFPMNLGSNNYKLQVGDRVVILFQMQAGIDPSSNYIVVDNNSNDPFDGNHSVECTFTATGEYPNYLKGGQYGVWIGYGGNWSVLTGKDMAGTFYT